MLSGVRTTGIIQRVTNTVSRRVESRRRSGRAGQRAESREQRMEQAGPIHIITAFVFLVCD